MQSDSIRMAIPAKTMMPSIAEAWIAQPFRTGVTESVQNLANAGSQHVLAIPIFTTMAQTRHAKPIQRLIAAITTPTAVKAALASMAHVHAMAF